MLNLIQVESCIYVESSVSIQSIHTLEISDDSLTMARTQFQTISRDTNSTFVQRGVVGLGDEDESVQGHSQEIPRV